MHKMTGRASASALVAVLLVAGASRAPGQSAIYGAGLQAWLGCWSADLSAARADAAPSIVCITPTANVDVADVITVQGSARLKLADRVFDLGRVVGELQHFFIQYANDKWLAEPFIGHFLWEYACHFPDRDAAFASITCRIPFYAGLTLLRIARNGWIGGHYSRRLLDEANKTLG